MAAGTWAATAAASDIVAANPYRKKVIVQLRSGDPTAVAFGETAVYAKGILLSNAGDSVTVTGYRATMAVSAICDTANTSAGGYDDGDLEYIPGSYAGS